MDKMEPLKVTPTHVKPKPSKILENSNVTEVEAEVYLAS
jgi:hypothetical protein